MGKWDSIPTLDLTKQTSRQANSSLTTFNGAKGDIGVSEWRLTVTSGPQVHSYLPRMRGNRYPLTAMEILQKIGSSLIPRLAARTYCLSQNSTNVCPYTRIVKHERPVPDSPTAPCRPSKATLHSTDSTPRKVGVWPALLDTQHSSMCADGRIKSRPAQSRETQGNGQGKINFLGL